MDIVDSFVVSVSVNVDDVPVSASVVIVFLNEFEGVASTEGLTLVESKITASVIH